MFCVLVKNESKMQLKKISTRRVYYGNSHYEIVTVKMKKGRFNRRAVERVINGRPIVKQVDITLPRNMNYTLFDSTFFRRQVEINTVFKILTLATRFKRSVSVAFIDLDCNYCGCLKPLMELSKEVYIITNEIEQYSIYADECFSLYGAAPIITDGAEIASRCNVIFSPDGKGTLDTAKCVFAPNKDCFHIEKGSVTAINGCVKNVDEISFAGALYELCGINRMGGLAADFMMKSGTKFSIDDIAGMICLDMG